MRFYWKYLVLILVLLAAPLVIYLSEAKLTAKYPEWPGQWSSYYQFADKRGWFAIPNFGDVMSNLPFLFIGAWGLWLLRFTKPTPTGRITQPWEKWAWGILFAGLLLTGFGSAYFHWAPGHATLFWDRIPMAIVFGAVASLLIGDRLSQRWGAISLWPLQLLTCGSVLWWHLTEQQGHGDLRPYAVVQFGLMVVLPLMLLLFPSRYTRTSDWWWLLLGYVVAKILEDRDKVIFQTLGGLISGHSLKHLASCLATSFMLKHFRRRRLKVA